MVRIIARGQFGIPVETWRALHGHFALALADDVAAAAGQGWEIGAFALSQAAAVAFTGNARGSGFRASWWRIRPFTFNILGIVTDLGLGVIEQIIGTDLLYGTVEITFVELVAHTVNGEEFALRLVLANSLGVRADDIWHIVRRIIALIGGGIVDQTIGTYDSAAATTAAATTATAVTTAIRIWYIIPVADLSRLIEFGIRIAGHGNGTLALANEVAIGIRISKHLTIPLAGANPLITASGARWTHHLTIIVVCGHWLAVHVPRIIADAFNGIEVEAAGTDLLRAAALTALNELRADARQLQQSSVRLIYTIRTLVDAVVGHITTTAWWCHRTIGWTGTRSGLRIVGSLPLRRRLIGHCLCHTYIRTACGAGGLRGTLHRLTGRSLLRNTGLIGTLLGTTGAHTILVGDRLAERQETRTNGTPLEIAFTQLRVEVQATWTAANLRNFTIFAHRKSSTIQGQGQTRSILRIGANIRPLRQRAMSSNQQEQAD